MTESMTPAERRVSMSLGAIMGLRMLGLFMILPVFALYAEGLHKVTPFLVGVAIGIYGFTQACLQIPFGMLSDRVGRKAVISTGLFIFAVGSVIAALSDSIYGVILGRALQGAGAISAAVMALAADLTREEHRTKAMAFIGMSIGSAFMLALVGGPILSQWIGVDGIFWLIGVLALAAVGVLYKTVPTPARSRLHRDAEPVPAQFRRVLSNPELLRLDAGIFILHTQITAMFVVLPLILKEFVGLEAARHWHVYLPVLLISVACMIPFVIVAEKRRRMKPVFTGAVAAIAGAQAAMALLYQQPALLFTALLLFFTAFNLLEAVLPSLISKTAPSDAKGTAMGVYSTSQFLGTFVGGVGGGWFHHHYGMDAVFLFCAGLSVLWLGLAATMQKPKYLSSHLLNVGTLDHHKAGLLTDRLHRIPGVEEVVVIIEDGVAYLKIDRKIVDMNALEQFSTPEEVCC